MIATGTNRRGPTKRVSAIRLSDAKNIAAPAMANPLPLAIALATIAEIATM